MVLLRHYRIHLYMKRLTYKFIDLLVDDGVLLALKLYLELENLLILELFQDEGHDLLDLVANFFIEIGTSYNSIDIFHDFMEYLFYWLSIILNNEKVYLFCEAFEWLDEIDILGPFFVE